MFEDMTLRKFSPKTKSHYVRTVINFTRFLERSPDTATPEDLRRYQLHLVGTRTSSISLNGAITALRFFFGVTEVRRLVMKELLVHPITKLIDNFSKLAVWQAVVDK